MWANGGTGESFWAERLDDGFVEGAAVVGVGLAAEDSEKSYVGLSIHVGVADPALFWFGFGPSVAGVRIVALYADTSQQISGRISG